jgi:uncharacterized protein YuzE
MRITYDPEADALYIRFRETIATTKQVAEGISADYDEEGNLAGIEVLEANRRLGNRQVFGKSVIDDIIASGDFRPILEKGPLES